MKIDILTLFPEMFAPLKTSIIGRAAEGSKLDITITDIRDYSKDKHKKCDDYPFGGGAGMVMTAQPIYDAILALDPNRESRRIYLSPKGKRLEQAEVKRLAKCGRLLLLCGHYEGVDQRALDLCIDEEVSIGDYVLTGGELAAMVVCDAVSRYVSGVISDESLKEESFENNLLEYPHYTRPSEFMGIGVPEVLRSGNHAEIEKWRRQESIKITKEKRPDLLKNEKL